jgi:multicomponent Na+:H+ antiporter subunit B
LKWIALAIVGLFTISMIYIEFAMPPYGDSDSPASTHVSPYYIENSEEDTDTPNIVTAVLADYRGYDTLGETTVIFTAGVVCMILLSKTIKDD